MCAGMGIFSYMVKVSVFIDETVTDRHGYLSFSMCNLQNVHIIVILQLSIAMGESTWKSAILNALLSFYSCYP